MFSEPRIRAWLDAACEHCPDQSWQECSLVSENTGERCSNVPKQFGAVISSESQ